MVKATVAETLRLTGGVRLNYDKRQTKRQQVTAALRYGGGRANMNSSAFNKLCAGRQVSVSIHHNTKWQNVNSNSKTELNKQTNY